ncbi:hypothetical protein [Azonexus sp.]|uniref:hypothetical protein n=1 Tax=Azonexus sp. TaxID=1872668 RepID=UPI0035B17C4C
MTLENLLAIHKLQRFEASAVGVQRLLAAAHDVVIVLDAMRKQAALLLDRTQDWSRRNRLDLVARPVGLSVIRPEQANRAFELLKGKLATVGGHAAGWGLKVFP